ncbi:hypothetical protein OG299_00775 [Streptomyces sp. NBC_01296]|nr:hypothetical protein OG299_00775 [Streptomyces sp. NBC_01296]
MPEVVSDLAFQSGLEDPLRELLQQTTPASQFDPVALARSTS